MLVPRPGIQPMPLHRKHRFLTTGLQGSPSSSLFRTWLGCHLHQEDFPNDPVCYCLPWPLFPLIGNYNYFVCLLIICWVSSQGKSSTRSRSMLTLLIATCPDCSTVPGTWQTPSKCRWTWLKIYLETHNVQPFPITQFPTPADISFP